MIQKSGLGEVDQTRHRQKASAASCLLQVGNLDIFIKIFIPIMYAWWTTWPLVIDSISHLSSPDLKNGAESLDVFMVDSSDLGPYPEAMEECTGKVLWLAQSLMSLKGTLLWLTKSQPLQLNCLGNTKTLILTKMFRKICIRILGDD